MKILITSFVFDPSIGGIETHSALFGEFLISQGHEVVVVTRSLGEASKKHSFEVVRDPDLIALFGWFQWAEVVFQNHPSLSLGWPGLFISRPTVILHQTWTTDGTFRANFMSRFKRMFASRSINLANSLALSKDVGIHCQVVGNPYDPEIFYPRPEIRRKFACIVVGRLVSDKGIDLAIRAIKNVVLQYPEISLDIVGEGKERECLEKLVEELGIQDRIFFRGALRGGALGEAYASCSIALIPSRWAEPFGIVALEGLASGCRLVCSRLGGLPEAAGPISLFFENNNEESLTNGILESIQKEDYTLEEENCIRGHLQQYKKTEYFKKLLSLLNEALVEHRCKNSR